MEDLSSSSSSSSLHDDETNKAQDWMMMASGEGTGEEQCRQQHAVTNNPPLEDFFSNAKLYGREREQEVLRKAYERVSSSSSKKTEFVFLRGATGSGKTVLATSTLRNQVDNNEGYFCSGKFDQLRRTEPQAVFVEAFTSYVASTVARGDLAVMKQKRAILRALGTEAQVLVDMVPSMKEILGNIDSTLRTQYSTEAVNRFRYVMRSFIRAVASPERPLVLFLDDLHFADDPTLDLLATLLTDPRTQGVMFVGTCRTSEDDDESEDVIANFLQGLSKDEVNLTVIELRNLQLDGVAEILGDVLDRDVEDVAPLAEHVYHQTRGNFFFLQEYLRLLRSRGHLRHCPTDSRWMWNIDDLTVEYQTIGDLLKLKMQTLDSTAREALKIASCLGQKIEEDLVSRILGEPITDHLEAAVNCGLVQMNPWNSAYEFVHDAVQEATYCLIPVSKRSVFHFDIAWRLWESLEVDELDDFLFAIAGQFMCSEHMEIEHEPDRFAVATLFLRAGEKAVSISSFHTSYLYLLHGIELLGIHNWQDNYSLSLDLYNAACEVAYCNGQFRGVELLCDEIIINAKAEADTYRALATKVYTLASSGRMEEALQHGLHVLQGFGVVFPSEVTISDAQKVMKKTRKLLKGKSNEYFLRMPTMTDPIKLAAMQILNLLFVAAYCIKLELAPMIGCSMVKLTIEHGLCAMSSFGFGIYATSLCGLEGDVDEGWRFGQVGIAIHERFKGKAWFSRLSSVYYSGVHPFKMPVQESIDNFLRGHAVGLECGDLEYAMLNANMYLWFKFDRDPLPKLSEEICDFVEKFEFFGQVGALLMIKPTWQTVYNLTGRAGGDVCLLDGEVMKETEINGWYNNIRSWAYYNKMMLCYLFGDYDKAVAHADYCRDLTNYPLGNHNHQNVVIFDALSTLMVARKQKPKQQKAGLALVKKHLEKLRYLASRSPFNFLGLQYLLEAELAVFNNEDEIVFVKYVSARALMKERGSMMLTALVNERIGKYFFDNDHKKEAKPYFEEAIRNYADWGATEKVKHLKGEIRYAIFS